MATLHHGITGQQCNRSVQISHRASTGSIQEAPLTISADSKEPKIIDALKLAMANLFLSRPYNLLELLQILEVAKHSSNFNASRVAQDFLPAKPARPYTMSIKFIDNKQKIQVSVNVGGGNVFAEPARTSHAKTLAKTHAKTIEMIRYLEEEYENL